MERVISDSQNVYTIQTERSLEVGKIFPQIGWIPCGL